MYTDISICVHRHHSRLNPHEQAAGLRANISVTAEAFAPYDVPMPGFSNADRLRSHEVYA
jgi:hypothetical protein